VNPSANNDPDDTSSLLQSRQGSREIVAAASVHRWPEGEARNVIAGVEDVTPGS
jgi:hypothetical protein